MPDKIYFVVQCGRLLPIHLRQINRLRWNGSQFITLN